MSSSLRPLRDFGGLAGGTRVVAAVVVMMMARTALTVSCVVASMAPVVDALRVIVLAVGPTIIISMARDGILVSMVIPVLISMFVSVAVGTAFMCACEVGVPPTSSRHRRLGKRGL